MSLRTVADDTLSGGAMWLEPTGWAVSMYSCTTARRMADLRSSSIGMGARRASRMLPPPTPRPPLAPERPAPSIVVQHRGGSPGGAGREDGTVGGAERRR